LGPSIKGLEIAPEKMRKYAFSHQPQQDRHMGNKIFTEADRKATPAPKPLPGYTLPTAGRGQRISLERGVATRSKKNPGKRHR
jgi:hypothetical protein